MASVLEVFVREDLEKLHSEEPNSCDKCSEAHPLKLYAPCHRKAGLRPAYYKGRLYFECTKCGDVIAVVAVGDEDKGEDPAWARDSVVH